MLQKRGVCLFFKVEDDEIRIAHSQLRRTGWQLRVVGLSANPQLERVSVGHADFMAKSPQSWLLVMLELNCDIYAASKRLLVGSVSTSKVKTQETARDLDNNLGGAQGIDAAPGTVDWAAPHQTRALEHCPLVTALRMSMARRRWWSG